MGLFTEVPTSLDNRGSTVFYFIINIKKLLTNLFNRKSAFWRFSTQQRSRVPHIGYKQFALEYQG